MDTEASVVPAIELRNNSCCWSVSVAAAEAIIIIIIIIINNVGISVTLSH